MISRRGFTLVELLIVVVIIGILASLAIARLKSSKEKTYVATMRSDLRNLGLAEEAFFYDSARYTPDVSQLTLLRRYAESPGVTVVINEATNKGWSATASHTFTSQRCFLFVGTAAPVGAATIEGRISCQ